MDRRSHYLDVALGLFTAHGYNGVSVDQVVAVAGGSKATLYRYFSSKRELFEALIEDLAARALPEDLGDELEALDLRTALHLLGTRIAAAALHERTIVLLRLAIGEAQRFPELGRVLFEHGPAVSYQRFGQFVRARIEAGELEVPDVEIAAEQFIAGMVGHQQLRMALGVSAPTDEDVAARVRRGVDAFCAAYATSATPDVGGAR